MAFATTLRAPASAELERPQLELSGPKLALAFESLVARTDEYGGVERFVEALKLRSELFAEALRDGKAHSVDLAEFKQLCACMPTVRRRASDYLRGAAYESLRREVALLMEKASDTSSTDHRLAAFCAAFPDGRPHRWVRDLAAEILHSVDPERYPLMCRWVWDASTNTGVIREIWHADDVDRITIDVPDRYGTFVMLREELAQFLASNGVFRDVIYYIDLLTAQVYANYLSEHGDSYLRADFATPEDPMLHTRRLLGLDAVDSRGRTRLRSIDGCASETHDLKQLN